jgi:hypothetical protein
LAAVTALLTPTAGITGPRHAYALRRRLFTVGRTRNAAKADVVAHLGFAHAATLSARRRKDMNTEQGAVYRLSKHVQLGHGRLALKVVEGATEHLNSRTAMSKEESNQCSRGATHSQKNRSSFTAFRRRGCVSTERLGAVACKLQDEVTKRIQGCCAQLTWTHSNFVSNDYTSRKRVERSSVSRGPGNINLSLKGQSR